MWRIPFPKKGKQDCQQQVLAYGYIIIVKILKHHTSFNFVLNQKHIVDRSLFIAGGGGGGGGSFLGDHWIFRMPEGGISHN